MIARPVDIYVNSSNNNNEYNSRYLIGFPDEETLDMLWSGPQADLFYLPIH